MKWILSSLHLSVEQHVYKYFSSIPLGLWLFKLVQQSKMVVIQWKQNQPFQSESSWQDVIWMQLRVC